MSGVFMPIFFILVAGGLFFTYVDPTYKSVQALIAENDRYDQALTKAKELQSARDGLLSRYNTFNDTDLERLQKMLPDQIDNVRLILDIESIAKQHGLTLDDFGFSGDSSESEGTTGATTQAGTPAPTQQVGAPAGFAPEASGVGGAGFSDGMVTSAAPGGPAPMYRSVGMTFTVEATYEEFISFMNDLERSLRIVDITSLSIDPSSDSGSTTYTYDIGINTYWLP